MLSNKTHDTAQYSEREMRPNLATGEPVIRRTPFHCSGSKKSKKGRGGGGGGRGLSHKSNESPFHIETHHTKTIKEPKTRSMSQGGHPARAANILNN